MARQHSPQQQFKEAKQIANDFGLLVVEKAGRYQVYRRMATRNVFVGERGTPDGLRNFVCKITNFH